MGKNKKGVKASVFKVAGANSLKKTKSKQVNLTLKNLKTKVEKIDQQFLELQKNPVKKIVEKPKAIGKMIQKQEKTQVLKDTAEATVKLDKMEV